MRSVVFSSLRNGLQGTGLFELKSNRKVATKTRTENVIEGGFAGRAAPSVDSRMPD